MTTLENGFLPSLTGTARMGCLIKPCLLHPHTFLLPSRFVENRVAALDAVR